MIFVNRGKRQRMGEAKKKPELDPESARALPARVALSLISSSPPDADEDASGRSEEALETDRAVESARGDRASSGP
jgi:hypothetical protein